jgi:hypothetical protein
MMNSHMSLKRFLCSKLTLLIPDGVIFFLFLLSVKNWQYLFTFIFVSIIISDNKAFYFCVIHKTMKPEGQGLFI